MTTNILKNILETPSNKLIIATVIKVLGKQQYVVEDASSKSFVVSSVVKRSVGDSVRINDNVVIESAPRVNTATVYMV